MTKSVLKITFDNFPDVIKRKRIELGLSQSRFAEEASMSKQQIVDIERRYRSVDNMLMSTLTQIIKTLDRLDPGGISYDKEEIVDVEYLRHRLLAIYHKIPSWSYISRDIDVSQSTLTDIVSGLRNDMRPKTAKAIMNFINMVETEYADVDKISYSILDGETIDQISKEDNFMTALGKYVFRNKLSHYERKRLLLAVSNKGVENIGHDDKKCES